MTPIIFARFLYKGNNRVLTPALQLQQASTIPILELEAALDAVKLAEAVMRELKLGHCPCAYWTDSTIVLLSLHADSKKFSVYSRNRISQIQEKTCINDWRHVPTKLNPANYASQGCAENRLIGSNTWFEGPKFLKRALSEWPKKLSLPSEKESVYNKFDLPRKKTSAMLAHSLIEPVIIYQLITRFSSLKKLSLATAWLLRLKQHLIDRCRGTDLTPWRQPVSALETQQAETELVIYVQRKYFPTWLSKLNGKQSYSDVPQLTTLQKLCPFLSNGVVRIVNVKSRSGILRRPVTKLCVIIKSDQ